MNIGNADMYQIMRRKKNITLKEIAENIGCTSALLCMYEKNKCTISPEKEVAYKTYIIERSFTNGYNTENR